MRKTLTLLVASTALSAAIGLTAWGAMHAPADGSPRPFATLFEDGSKTLPVILAGNDDDDDDRGYRETSRRGHDYDDDDNDDDDDDYDDDDDDDERRGGGNSAPAGTVAPPQNGLFGNGTPPQVQVN